MRCEAVVKTSVLISDEKLFLRQLIINSLLPKTLGLKENRYEQFIKNLLLKTVGLVILLFFFCANVVPRLSKTNQKCGRL